MHAAPRHQQQGVFLVEALIAILIFSIGVLGVVAMGTSALAAQTDVQYRTRAAALANEMASNITLNVDRTTEASLRASVASFLNNEGGSNCSFSGAASNNALFTAWSAKVLAQLPGSDAQGIHIDVNSNAAANGFNRVEITLCWKAPNDKARRSHTLVTYVNGDGA